MPHYLVLATRTPQFRDSVIAPHQAFLEKLRESGQLEMSGPFKDKTGGAYVLNAESFAAAEALAFTDPLHLTGSSTLKIYEWSVT